MSANGFSRGENREAQIRSLVVRRMDGGNVRQMVQTVAECEVAIADCEKRLIALKVSLADVRARAETPKREELTRVAGNAVRVLEAQLESLHQDLSAALGRNPTARG